MQSVIADLSSIILCYIKCFKFSNGAVTSTKNLTSSVIADLSSIILCYVKCFKFSNGAVTSTKNLTSSADALKSHFITKRMLTGIYCIMHYFVTFMFSRQYGSCSSMNFIILYLFIGNRFSASLIRFQNDPKTVFISANTLH